MNSAGIQDIEQQGRRRVLLENAEVLVVETTYPKGGSVPMHEHQFPHVLYVIEGGTIQATSPDGSVKIVELRPKLFQITESSNAACCRHRDAQLKRRISLLSFPRIRTACQAGDFCFYRLIVGVDVPRYFPTKRPKVDILKAVTPGAVMRPRRFAID